MRDVGELPLVVCRELVEEVLVVEEETIERAIVALLEIEKTVAEGAGAAALAALLDYPRAFAGKVGLVLSRRQHRQPRARLGADARPGARRAPGAPARHDPRRPGSLAKVAALIAKAGGNIVEVQHQRVFGGVVARPTELDFMIETRDRAPYRRAGLRLQADGFTVRVLEGVEA